MKKVKILTCLLAILCVTSCKKDSNPSTLSGTQWVTTIQQVNVLLSFSSNTNGILRVTDSSQGIDEKIEFTYTYSNPNALLRPTDPEYAANFPNGIKASVHGNVMDFSDFWQGEQITLTKK
jgi:hypothetical protein